MTRHLVEAVRGPVSLIGNLFGLDSQAVPRSWSEAAYMVPMMAVAWAWYAYVREFRPGRAKWQLGWSLLGVAALGLMIWSQGR